MENQPIQTNSENTNRTNLEILLYQNDIISLLQKVNKINKKTNLQISLAEAVNENKVKLYY
jgi:hypothetical protein